MNGLEQMLAELESSRLEVILVPLRRPANVGGMARVAASVNAPWYRRFCAAFPSDRIRRKAAFDTRIKRANTVAALNALIAGHCRSKYAPALLRIAAKYSPRLEAVA